MRNATEEDSHNILGFGGTRNLQRTVRDLRNLFVPTGTTTFKIPLPNWYYNLVDIE